MAEGDSGQVFDAARDDRDRHPEMLRCECDHGTVGGAAGCEHIDEPSAAFDAGVVGWDSQQRLRQRSVEGADHLGERPGLDDLPRLQQRDGIADAFDHVHLVGDHQNGQIELGAQIEDQVEDLVGGAGVEGGGGFVAQEHGGFGRQRPRDTDPLPLPARQLRRVGVRRVRQPDELQQVEGTLPRGGPASLDFQGVGDVAPHRAGVEQVRVLEHQPQAPAGVAQRG